MQLSIVIVNYNVKHFLEQCLISVKAAMEGMEAEVFVVDNNSVDGSQQMLKDRFPWVTLIENHENTGFSKANNQAIRISKGKYVLLLNPDTVVKEGTFKESVAFMDHNEKAGALGVKMIDGNGAYLPESKRGLPTPWVSFYKIFGLSRIFPKSKRFGKYYMSHLSSEETNEVEVLSGAFMLLRKSVLDKIGLLDEAFFMYGEDIDMSYRVIKAGYKNYYYPDTQIIHYKGESTKKGSLNYVKVFYNAMIIFAQKHFSKGHRRLFISLIKIAVYIRAVMAVVNRVANAISFPLFEGSLIYLAIYSIKEYWEYIHKLLKDGLPYPAEFDYIAAPIYTLVFVGFLAIVGAYKKPFKLKPIMTACFSGFIAIATVSYVFPEINFSRMIVGLAAVATALIALITRGFINFRESGSFFFTEETKRRVVIAGLPEDAEGLAQLIRGELNYPVVIEGYVSVDANDKVKTESILGNISQLKEIIPYYQIDEIIFSNESLPTDKIIEIMADLKSNQVQFKIAPPGADYLVGPQVIHSSLYDGLGYYNLNDKDLLVKKRLFDFMSSLTLLLFFPIHFWIYKKPLLALGNLWNVLRGEYHLVGYIRTNPEGLPEIKEGVLNMLHRVKKSEKSGGEYSSGLDRHYARAYSLELDLEILMKGIRKIGEVNKRLNYS